MNESLEQARDAINLYTFGMDSGNWPLAVSKFADTVEVDYSAVGAPKGRMARKDLRVFFKAYLEKSTSGYTQGSLKCLPTLVIQPSSLHNTQFATTKGK